MASSKLELKIGLNAAIIAVLKEEPLILITPQKTAPQADSAVKDQLPFGPFHPREHRTMEEGLRAWVLAQTGLHLGYVEQLYTFADRGRHAQKTSTEHEISVGYLALHNKDEIKAITNTNGTWHKIYQFFPWEDWRGGRPQLIDEAITPYLHTWIKAGESKAQQAIREERAALCFGGLGLKWDEEKVLERYELLYELGLVEEAQKDGKAQAGPPAHQLGVSMHQDHRRILATAMGRLRGKLKYRPVVFELMAASFTLFQLQRCVEAISGLKLHKQNFRRQVERTGLVEETGHMTSGTEGRPAKIFQFRQSVMRERLAPGLRVSSSPQRR